LTWDRQPRIPRSRLGASPSQASRRAWEPVGLSNPKSVSKITPRCLFPSAAAGGMAFRAALVTALAVCVAGVIDRVAQDLQAGDAVAAPVRTLSAFKSATSTGFKSRGKALAGVDDALAQYWKKLDNKSLKNKADDLAVVTDRILAWYDTKPLDANGVPTSPHLAAVDGLLSEVEAERSRLEGLLISQIATTPIAANAAAFTHVTVVAGVTDINDVGAFEKASAAEEANARAGLVATRQTRLGARLSMLEARLASADTIVATELAGLGAGNTQLVVYLEGEWFFKRPGYPFTQADTLTLQRRARAWSAARPNWVIVPGTMMWGSGRAGTARLFNTVFVLQGGALVKTLNKWGEGGDTVGYFKGKKHAQVLATASGIHNHWLGSQNSALAAYTAWHLPGVDQDVPIAGGSSVKSIVSSSGRHVFLVLPSVYQVQGLSMPVKLCMLCLCGCVCARGRQNKSAHRHTLYLTCPISDYAAWFDFFRPIQRRPALVRH
jgi:hypothetical protein